jgi:hypothetical protein
MLSLAFLDHMPAWSALAQLSRMANLAYRTAVSHLAG